MNPLKLILPLYLMIIGISVFADKVSKDKAETIAKNWGKQKMKISDKAILSQSDFVFKNDTLLYIFSFGENGFAIVPTDDNTYPILAYSSIGKFDLENISPELKSWLNYYADMINFNKKIEKYSTVKKKWDEIEGMVNLKSIQTTVSSLFESTGSSRWATWRPYFNKAPAAQSQFYEGWSGCVPLVLSQIMKYYKYPLIGTGSNSYSYDGINISENFNSIFNYNLMPFRLTYCARGGFNCNDPQWGTIPGITQQQIDEVGKLQYLAGVGVDMNWLANRDTSELELGTFGTTDGFAQSLVDHFYYSSDYSYWGSTAIQNDKTGFKQALRNTLNNGNPALFRYSCHGLNGPGHIVAIDGYENDEFFHFITGQGGWEDAYYYLFPEDANGSYLPRPHIDLWGLESVVNLHPDCPSSQNVTLSNIIITDGEGELIQSGNNLTISNFTIENGGGAVLKANNEITISSNFEVEVGGEVLIVSQPCSN
jgi:hypothetical protein